MQVIFTNTDTSTNTVKVREMILRLFLGAYGEDDGKELDCKKLKFPTQESIAEAIKLASNGKHHPAQSSIAKELAKLEGETIRYKDKDYYIGNVDGYYKLIDAQNLIETAKKDLQEWRPFLGKKIFINNTNAFSPSTVYAFRLVTNKVESKELKKLFKNALGDSYFGMIQHKEVLFLFLNANSDNLKKDSEWLDNYFKK